jgi:hypothetical protein
MELDLHEREAELDFRREMHKLELEKRQTRLQHQRARQKHGHGWKKGKDGDGGPLLILLAIVHILTAIWVYQDIRKRGVGSGIWIVIALLTGLIGTLVYAVVRLGNTPQTPK